MKKIAKVILHQFRSHEHTEVDLDNFTTITGPTDAGKSAIVKGIRWALYNEPSGDRMVQWGKDTAYVELVFNDNSRLMRLREKSTNVYKMTETDGKVTELENFGVGPVKMVEEFHGMPKKNLFGYMQSINLCTQFEAPFFLSESPRKRATMIGHVAGTDILDLAYDNTNLDVRRKKVEAKDLKENIKEKKEELKGLKNVPQAEKSLESMRESLQQSEKANETKKEIRQHQEAVEVLNEKQENLKVITSFEGDAEHLKDITLSAEQLFRRAERIRGVYAKLTEATKKQEDLNTTLTAVDEKKLSAVFEQLSHAVSLMEKLDRLLEMRSTMATLEGYRQENEEKVSFEALVDPVVADLTTAEQLITQRKAVGEKYELLTVNKERAKRGMEVIRGLEKKYRTKQREYEDMLKESGHCPLCLTPVGKEMLERMKN